MAHGQTEGKISERQGNGINLPIGRQKMAQGTVLCRPLSEEYFPGLPLGSIDRNRHYWTSHFCPDQVDRSSLPIGLTGKEVVETTGDP
ncbi:MAG: hypothetical protein RIM83_08170 [Allomuricauda sp.]